MMQKILKSRNLPLHLMVLPGIVLVFLFSYVPMAGIVISFQKFMPNKGFFGSQWVGLDNYIKILNQPDLSRAFYNTLFISSLKIIAGQIIPISFALLLNEVGNKLIKRSVQTMIYLPHFLSWVILGGIMIDILSTKGGILNQFLGIFGVEPIFFLGDNRWFPYVLVFSDIWKEFGFSTVIYLAAITSIDPSLYEASIVDGAGKFRQAISITLPGMAPVIILVATLSLGNILNAGFEQVFNLYKPIVYQSGDILDTLVFRLGISGAAYGVATAVGLFKSVISLLLISISYTMAYKIANYRIF